jgi:hypothetical protein
MAMKLNGKPLPGPSMDFVVLPRPKTQEPDPENEGQMREVNNDLVFKCRAVLDFSEFEAKVPDPKPIMVTRPNQAPTPDFNHPEYLKQQLDYGLKKQNWLTIQSLMATPNLEWERVDLDNPETWKEWSQELQDGGVTIGEMLRIQQKVHQVNGLDEEKFDEARKAFLATSRGKEPS